MAAMETDMLRKTSTMTSPADDVLRKTSTMTSPATSPANDVLRKASTLTSPATSPENDDRKLRRASCTSVDRRGPVPIMGNFIRADTARSHAPSGQIRWTCEWIETVLSSYYFANFMAAIILLDAYCACRDIDARAAENPEPVVFLVISDLCLALYTFEVCGMLYMRHWAGLSDPMVLLDVLIVMAGYVELLMQALASRDLNVNMQVMRVLRLARIIRLMRLLKKVRAFRELFKLVTMMSTCFLTLLWSFLFCFLVMTGWAMLMVEYVHPLVVQLDQEGAFGNCGDLCTQWTSSVMDANLLLFKTVVAGDSWGEIAVPVIRKHPETAFIFVGSSLTIVFGVLNLIVAVIVDTFAEARSNEFDDLAEELNDDMEYDRKELEKLFDRIDREGSGKLTLDDLVEGARTDPSFQSRLRVMDIDEHDLQQLFQMIDADGSGYIEASEFVGPLSRWVHDSKTAPRFIKYNMMQSLQLQEDIFDLAQTQFDRFAEQLEEVSKCLSKLAPKEASAAADLTDAAEGDILPPAPVTALNDEAEDAAEAPSASVAKPAELEAELRATAEKLEASMAARSFEVNAGLRSAMMRLEHLISPDARKRPGTASGRRPSFDLLAGSRSMGSRARVGSLFKQIYLSDEMRDIREKRENRKKGGTGSVTSDAVVQPAQPQPGVRFGTTPPTEKPPYLGQPTGSLSLEPPRYRDTSDPPPQPPPPLLPPDVCDP